MDLEEAKQRIAELEKLVEHYAEGQVWYSESLEALAGTRYHLHEFLQGCQNAISTQNTLKKFGKPVDDPDVLNIFIHRKTYKEAKKCLDKANDHFSGKKRTR